MGPRRLGLKEIYGLLVPPGKASMLLPDQSRKSGSSQTILHTCMGLIGLVKWLYLNHFLDVMTSSSHKIEVTSRYDHSF